MISGLTLRCPISVKFYSNIEIILNASPLGCASEWDYIPFRRGMATRITSVLSGVILASVVPP